MDEPIEFYANSVNVASQIYDVLIEFALQTPITYADNSNTVERKILTRVRMSPPHAKALAAILVKQAMEYEANFGKLSLPDDMAAMWATYVEKGGK